MLIKRDQDRKLRGEDVPALEITPERLYLDRRTFIAGAAALALVPSGASAERHLAPLKATKNPAFTLPDALTSYKNVTSYNNFYEFGTNKDDPERLQASLKTRPWTVKVEGLCAKPRTFDIEELL